jgi:hypothetical protein
MPMVWESRGIFGSQSPMRGKRALQEQLLYAQLHRYLAFGAARSENLWTGEEYWCHQLLTGGVKYGQLCATLFPDAKPPRAV